MKTHHLVALALVPALAAGYLYTHQSVPADQLPIAPIVDISPAVPAPITGTETIVADPGVYPDATLTPGALNFAVTQATISQNICNTSWSTKSIRPPATYTTALKKKQLAAGYTLKGDMNTADYEEDHLISLELGGNPTSEQNLWPEPYNIPHGAKMKDKVENYLHAQVCAGTITLSDAQYEISHDWHAVYVSAGLK